ncbi:hypothetical protein [Promicromonospora sukumoe]|uniref:hypothetical protein n=1 Tax=Promicromonospora sukumoe TaxID=88382 RepID=UPI0003635661|nr:hypothetical protein [Promicromonospora sukumoe]
MRGSPDVPRGFETVASRLSSAANALIHVYTQLYSRDALADLRRMIEEAPTSSGIGFDALPVDADEVTRQRVVEELTPEIVRQLRRYPWLTEPGAHLSKSEQVTREMFAEAVVELYNPAQIDVLRRASLAARAELDREPVSAPPD